MGRVIQVRPGRAPAGARVPAPGGRVRVMGFVTNVGTGGTERQFVNLEVGLDRTRFDVRVGCLKRAGALLGELESHGVPVEEYRISSLLALHAARQQLNLARDLTRHGVDLVHAYNFYGNAFALPAAYMAKTPVIVASVRDLGIYLTPAQRRAHRLVCRLADRVVVNAEAIRQWLIADGWDSTRISVIRNGIDLRRFDARGRRPDVRDALGVPRDAPLVACVSRVVPGKGLEDLIDATAAVTARVPDAHVLIVGGEYVKHEPGGEAPGTYPARLAARARAHGLGDRVRFVGHWQDVPGLLASINVSVLPSLSEGLSNSVLEAMAAGVPVVATRVGGTPEVVTDGATGLLVPPGEPAALGAALLRVLESPALAAEMGRAGRRVAELLSVERMVRATESLYLDLLHRRAARAAS